MAGKVVILSFVLLSKFGASGQESASKTATSHIREPLAQSTSTEIVSGENEILLPLKKKAALAFRRQLFRQLKSTFFSLIFRTLMRPHAHSCLR